jgi:Type VI secretion system effector, Hcp
LRHYDSLGPHSLDLPKEIRMIGRLRSIGRLIAATMLTFSFTALPALAATEAYIDFGPSAAQGELKTGLTAAQPDWIAVTSFHINPAGKDGAVPGSATAGPVKHTGGGKPASMDVVLAPGAAADKLFELAKKATLLSAVRLQVLRRNVKGLIPYETMLMTGVVITSVDWTGKPTDASSTKLTFNYDRAEIKQNAASTQDDPAKLDPITPVTWNLGTNLEP